MEAAMRLDPNTNNECLHLDLIELNPFLSRAEALSLLTQWIARPLVEESISDALSRAYTIVRDSSPYRRNWILDLSNPCSNCRVAGQLLWRASELVSGVVHYSRI